MHDNDFSVKEASRLLGCTPQNIYKQKDIMLQRGQWIIDENKNNYITAEGLAYLREKRAETIKAKSQEFNEVESNRLSTEAKATETASIVDLLQEQIKELKSFEVDEANFVNSLTKDTTSRYVLPTTYLDYSVTWEYLDTNDAKLYNIKTGEVLVEYLATTIVELK